MKKLLLICSTLLATGCNYSPDDQLDVRWAIHLPQITVEPNYQIMLQGDGENLCILSIMDSSLKIGADLSVTKPGELSTDIDYHWDDHYFVLDSSDDTYIKAAITGNSSDLLTVTLDTKLVDVFSKDYFTVSQSFLVSTDPNHYDIPNLTMRDEPTNQHWYLIMNISVDGNSNNVAGRDLVFNQERPLRERLLEELTLKRNLKYANWKKYSDQRDAIKNWSPLSFRLVVVFGFIALILFLFFGTFSLDAISQPQSGW